MSLLAGNEVNGNAPQLGSQTDTERYLELNYRVANSLQLVSSFLSLQEREVPDPQAKQALHIAASRVAAVGRVQRAVLGGRNPTMDLRPFLSSLCVDLAVLTGLAVEVDAETIVVTASAAEHIAVVVSELVVNAASHDVKARNRKVVVTCHRHRSGDKVTLTIVDRGSGPFHGFEDRAEGVGMIILRSAAGLLNGALTFDSKNDAMATLSFRSPRRTHTALYS